MSLTLGPDPVPLVVTLVRGATWFQGLRSTTGSWPDGTVVELRLGDTVWTATVDGDLLRWTIAAADVDLVINSGARDASLWLVTTGGERVPWASGRVSVRG